MSRAVCPVCGKRISDMALLCPRCGRPGLEEPEADEASLELAVDIIAGAITILAFVCYSIYKHCS
jgi:hypothetical protein